MNRPIQYHVLFSIMVGLILVGCSVATSTPSSPSQPVPNWSPSPSIEIAQVSPSPTRPISVVSTSYPATLPSATPAPYPAIPTRGLRITLTPTPIIHWNTEVIKGNWPEYDTYGQPEWLSNTVARLAKKTAGMSEEFIQIDISAGKSALPVTVAGDSDLRIFSPNRTFAVECGADMRMIRGKDNSMVSSTSLLPPISPGVYCSVFIFWAADESAVSFIAADRNVYVWQSNGAEPKKIAGPLDSTYTNIAWSPDSKELIYLKTVSPARIGKAEVVDMDGHVLREVNVLFGDSAIFQWMPQNVLVSISRSETWYYDLNSGNLLFNWKNIPWGDTIWHQSVKFSPDGRWAFIDQGDQMQMSVSEPNRVFPQKIYTLYDIQTKSRRVLLNYLGNYLWFAGWSADSQKLFVVNRPAEPKLVSDPSTPFGLLAYDLQTENLNCFSRMRCRLIGTLIKARHSLFSPCRINTVIWALPVDCGNLAQKL